LRATPDVQEQDPKAHHPSRNTICREQRSTLQACVFNEDALEPRAEAGLAGISVELFL